jgi:hypothetical protein
MAYNPKARRMRRNRDLQRKRSPAGVAARERLECGGVKQEGGR